MWVLYTMWIYTHITITISTWQLLYKLLSLAAVFKNWKLQNLHNCDLVDHMTQISYIFLPCRHIYHWKCRIFAPNISSNTIFINSINQQYRNVQNLFLKLYQIMRYTQICRKIKILRVLQTLNFVNKFHRLSQTMCSKLLKDFGLSGCGGLL